MKGDDKKEFFRSEELKDLIKESENLKPSLVKEGRKKNKVTKVENVSVSPISIKINGSKLKQLKKDISFKDKRIKELKEESNFEATKAQNYLSQITKLNAEIDSLKIDLENAQKEKEKIEDIIDEKDQIIRNYLDKFRELYFFENNN